MTSPLARLPKMDRVLAAGPLASCPWRRDVVRRVADALLDELRARLQADADAAVPDTEAFAGAVADRLVLLGRVHPGKVVNATGVLLHTNLGRAPLGPEACEAMLAAAGACDLEVDLASGRRGSRFTHIRTLARMAIDAPDVHVVNNNAAALLIACTVLGRPGGVALSIGQMVEIGDGFRVATMAGAGGCRVVPVGSTNRTHLADYAAALSGPDPVAALLWVHRSNFDQVGYVAEVGLADLAALAREKGVPLIADLGSGSLGGALPTREPTIHEWIAQGADLVLASGDKLLGGPQAGIIAGRADLVERVRRDPMARALRPDKTTIAALHATLIAHVRGDGQGVPLIAMATATIAALRARAERIAGAVTTTRPVVVTESEATIGGGSLPGETMPSVALRIGGSSIARLADVLRMGSPPVIGRVENGALWLDLRSVAPGDDEALIRALAGVLG